MIIQESELSRSERLAVARTVMAGQRTIMAWVRTAVGMISFGFTLFKILGQFMTDELRQAHPHGPARLGLFLVGLGTLGLLGGLWEYLELNRSLGRSTRQILFSPSLVLACAVSCLGLALIFSILSGPQLW